MVFVVYSGISFWRRRSCCCCCYSFDYPFDFLRGEGVETLHEYFCTHNSRVSPITHNYYLHKKKNREHFKHFSQRCISAHSTGRIMHIASLSRHQHLIFVRTSTQAHQIPRGRLHISSAVTNKFHSDKFLLCIRDEKRSGFGCKRTGGTLCSTLLYMFAGPNITVSINCKQTVGEINQILN